MVFKGIVIEKLIFEVIFRVILMNEASFKNTQHNCANSSAELILTEKLARTDPKRAGLWLDPPLDWDVGRF